MKLRVCRAYGYTIEQVESMDYLAYMVALKELADCPIVDKTLQLIFGRKDKSSLTVAERRNAKKGRNR